MYFQTKDASPGIRKLWRSDIPEITDHLLRLDRDSRRARFGAFVGDGSVRAYAKRIFDGDSVVFGAFPDGKLRAIGELRGTRPIWRPDAEAALSVERAWQERGIGSALFDHIMTAAQNRNIAALHVLFLHENERMRRITAKYHPDFEFYSGEVQATLAPPWPTPFSVAREVLDFAGGYMQRLLKPAI